MIDLELLAIVVLIEAAPISRQAEREILRHVWRCAKAIINRLTTGGAS